MNTLERVLSSNDSTQVISPYMARDRTTGNLREHDVAVIMTNGHHKVVTAIECRDLSRPVGVPQVEGFHQKCLDTGINRGVIVSGKGFFKSALQKARHFGIECLRLEEVDSFPWLEIGTMKYFKTRLDGVNCRAIPDPPLAENPKNFRFKTADGSEITNDMLLNLVQLGMNKKFPPESMVAGSHDAKFRILAPGCFIEDLDSGSFYPFSFFLVQATLVVECTDVPITKLMYHSEDGVNPIGRVGIAQFDGSPFPMSIVFSRNPDESTDILLLKNSPGKSPD